MTAGSRAQPPWVLARGQPGRRAVQLDPGETLEVALEPGGHARYAALSLGSASGGWRPPPPSAWYHLAAPEEPVRYRMVGPTLLDLRAAPADGGEGEQILVEVFVDGERRHQQRWPHPVVPTLTGGAQAFGAPEHLALSLWEGGAHDVELRASGGTVAVSAARRVAEEAILASAPERRPPPPVTADAEARPPVMAWRPSRQGGLRRTLPPRWGAVSARASVSDRASLDAEELGAHVLFVELAGSHHLRAGRAESWFSGGPLVRLSPEGRPVVGLELSTEHRLRPAELRLRGRLRGLVQATPDGAVGALELRARVDRPTRLAPGLTLVPHLAGRGFIQPRRALDWKAGEADVEIASRYRAAHPFGLGVGLGLLWRPWVNGEWYLAAGLVTNPEVISVDNAGARLELRLYPRPVGIALGFDLSRRFRDEWRPEPWWRAELAGEAWLDLGPPGLWIRPSVRVAWLLRPSRLEATLGVSVTPGRRSIHHMAPGDLLFEDIREPEPAGGRWRR